MKLKPFLSSTSKLPKILLCEKEFPSTILGILGLALAIGFLFSNSASTHYHLILDFAPAWGWFLTFLAYGVLKLLEIFKDINKYLVLALSTTGMWLWGYLFLSSALDGNNITPMEMLISFPLLCEVWTMAIILNTTKQSLYGKESDGRH